MKKKWRIIIILAAVLLICGLYKPVACAAEKMTAEEILQAPALNDNDAMDRIFKEADAAYLLADADAGKREAFLEKLSEEEMYKLMFLYRYTLAAEAAKQCIPAESTDGGAADKKKIREKIDKELEFYKELLTRLHEFEKQSETDCEKQVNMDGTDQTEADTEDAQVPETDNQAETDLGGGNQDNIKTAGENRMETECNQDKDDLHKSWEQSAFDIFRETVMANESNDSTGVEEVNDFDSYTEYLKGRTECDIDTLLRLLEGMGDTTDSRADLMMEEAKALLYHAYAVSSEADGKESEAESEDEEEKDGSEKGEEEADHVKEDAGQMNSIQAGKASAQRALGTGRAGRPANAVARIGSNYYTTFNSAFNALPNGGTLYVLRDCEATHIVTTKSFSIYPEERNVKVTFRESSLTPAGIICTPQGAGEPTWTIGGKDGYTITFDANHKGSSGVLSCYKATINLKSGVRLTNAYGNGVWNDSGITNVYDGAWIYNNGSHGIATFATINIYGGKIYGNQYDGMRSQKAINVSGGEIYNNRECGVHVGEGSCTFTMTGGLIHDNITGVGNINGKGVIQISAGEIFHNRQDGINTLGRQMTITGNVRIYGNTRSGVVIGGGTASISGGSIYENPVSGIVNRSTLNISGGEIYSNTADNGGGIQNYGTLNMSGGSITGNRAADSGGGLCLYAGSSFHLSGGTIRGNTAVRGNGICHNGTTMSISGNGAVDTGNDVYLYAGKFVSVTGRLNGQQAAMLTPADYSSGRKAAEYACDNKKGSSCFRQFSLTPNGSYCLRPGDYQVSQSGAKNEDIVLSTRYQVSYNKNIDADIQNMPGETDKYWYETANLSSLTPSSSLVRFRGWSENSNAETAEFQPGNEINASINRGITLYAVWKTKIKINYIGNGTGTDDVRSDYVTLKDCTARGGYTVRKNAEFTKYERERSSFAGWDITSDASAKNVRFPESETCILSYEELLSLAAKQQGSDFSNEELLQEVTLYASWDEAPVISADGVSEFYEGTEVTKEMLLRNMKAADREDGSLSDRIRILQIKYADGKRADGEKQKGQTDEWPADMPDDYQLDTWFMQMDPEDSPVAHKITYAVTDSFGNETKYEWSVMVKYNQFPEIEAEDWYFTLEEAKSGVITEEVLLIDAVLSGRVKASDQEDDELYPGKIQENIKLHDFHEEDFVTFEESGYLVITYSVKDSMGPQGEGKETFRQCTVHIVKDGEVIKPEAVKYVRFISREYYERNLDLKEEKNGGLSADSKWYQVPEYREKITGIWEPDRTAEEVWKFAENDVRKVKDYVKKHGIGNSREEKALNEFADSFKYTRK